MFSRDESKVRINRNRGLWQVVSWAIDIRIESGRGVILRNECH